MSGKLFGVALYVYIVLQEIGHRKWRWIGHTLHKPISKTTIQYSSSKLDSIREKKERSSKSTIKERHDRRDESNGKEMEKVGEDGRRQKKMEMLR